MPENPHPHFDVIRDLRFDHIDLRVFLLDLELHRELYLKRVFPTFNNMEEEAKKAGNKVYDAWHGNYEDYDSAMDASYDRYVERSVELAEMRQIAIHGGFISLAHFLEKWINHHLELCGIKGCLDKKGKKKPCNLYCFVQALNHEVEYIGLADDMEFVRLVANCSKHDEGKSCTDLHKRFPEAFPYNVIGPASSNLMYLEPKRFRQSIQIFEDGFSRLNHLTQ